MAMKRKPGRPNTIARALFGVPWGRMEPRDRREEVALVLRLSDSERMRFLAQRALDPAFDRTSFATLCGQFNVTYKQVADAYKIIKHSEGLLRASDHLPDLMEQVAVDAKSRSERCLPCNGTGKVLDTVADAKAKKEAEEREEEHEPITRTCVACKGEGKVYIPGEVERLKLVFDMIEPRVRAGVNVNLDLRDTGKSEKLEELAGSVAGIVNGAVVDAEEEPTDAS